MNNGLIEKVFYRKQTLSKNIEKIDLQGHCVIPGFTDCHTHLVSKGIALQRIDLEQCTSLKDCFEKIRAELHRDNEILFGVSWDESKWQKDEKNKLNKNVLDKISLTKPIIMRRVCGHFAVVNAKALTFIPKHWQIVDRQSGYLYEDVALNLNEIFKPSETMFKKAIDLATTYALAHGVTSIHEITNPRQLEILQTVNSAGRLKLRVSIYLPIKYLSSDLQIRPSNDFLKFMGIKIFVDGSIGAKTAGLTRSYKNSRFRGELLFSKQNLSAVVRNAEANGFQLMIHTIGDRATHQVLYAFENCLKKGNRLRHRLEHIEILDDSAIDQMAKMNLIASMQPNFVRRWQNPGGLYDTCLGARYKDMNPFRKLVKAGVRLIFGSDCMPLGPLYGIQGAVEHPFATGRLTRFEALKLYTKEGPYATFDERKKGTLETGNLADLAVLDKDPLEKNDLDKIKILMVFVDGDCVYNNHALTKRFHE